MVARQLGIFPNPVALLETEKINRHSENRPIYVEATTLLVGNVDFVAQSKEDERHLQTPFLQPTCFGNESNLMECQQYGISVLLDPGKSSKI